MLMLIFLVLLQTQCAIAIKCVKGVSLTLVGIPTSLCEMVFSWVSKLWLDFKMVLNLTCWDSVELLLDNSWGVPVHHGIPSKDTFRWWPVAVEKYITFHGFSHMKTHGHTGFPIAATGRYFIEKTLSQSLFNINHSTVFSLDSVDTDVSGTSFKRAVRKQRLFRYVQLMDESPRARCAQCLHGHHSSG